MQVNHSYIINPCVLMPLHTDDYNGAQEELGRLIPMREEFIATVLEVRPRSVTLTPWYRVRTRAGVEGWINGAALNPARLVEV